MGAGRMGFNLFKKAGWKNLFYALKYKSSINYLWSDTFSQIWCLIVGHKKYNSGELDNKIELACKRCHQWLK